MTVLRVLARRRLGLVAAAATVLFATTTAGCSPPRAACDYAPFADTITGTVVAHGRATATFVVATVTPGKPFSGALPRPPTVAKGQRLLIHYFRGQAQFLRVGRSYRVDMWWISNRFESGVHVANEACSTGTVYSDGSAINTSIWLATWVRRVIAVAALLAVIALSVAVWKLTRRRQRR